MEVRATSSPRTLLNTSKYAQPKCENAIKSWSAGGFTGAPKQRSLVVNERIGCPRFARPCRSSWVVGGLALPLNPSALPLPLSPEIRNELSLVCWFLEIET